MLTRQELLTIWECGQNQHPVDQALTILQFAFPDMARDEYAELSIGHRDYLLLDLRERLFGEKLNGVGTCPNCNKSVDISFTTNVIRTQPVDIEEREAKLTWNDHQIIFRLPNSWDLAAIARSANEECARKILIERCVVKILQNELPISTKELPQEAIEKIEQVIAERDPQAEILLDLNCPECGSQWQLLFDIASYLWVEIAVRAKRLLEEIHILAIAYHWTEKDILELNDTRRQIYLEMVNA